MDKCAGTGGYLAAMNPLNNILGPGLDTSKFPKVLSTQSGNEAFWNTVFSTAALTAGAALVKFTSNTIQERKFDKAKDKVHVNKVNALHSYNTPNYAPQKAAVTKVRNKGVDEDSTEGSKESEKKEDIQKSSSSPFEAIIPPLVSIPAGIWFGGMLSDALTKKREKELDKKILDERNKLDALYAELLKRYQSRVNKVASSPVSPAKPEIQAGSPGFWDRTLTTAILGPALVMGLSAMASYAYTSKHDKDRQKVKVLKKQVLPQNLTNAPAEVELLLGNNESVPEDIKEQTYIH